MQPTKPSKLPARATHLADEHVVLPRGMVVDGLGGLEQEPDDVDQDLHEDEARAQDQLRLRRDEGRPLRSPLRRVEYARYSEMRSHEVNELIIFEKS